MENIRVGLGTGGMGGYFDADPTTENEVMSVLEHALDLGVRFFDTASNYAGGYTEQLLGKAIRDRRHEVIVASKFGVECKTAADVRGSLEASLRRLGTDYIDLYQNHWPNYEADFEGILCELRLLSEEGKIRKVGLCNSPLQDIEFAIRIIGGFFATIQDEYNLLERGTEIAIQPFCRSNDITFLSYSPFLGGRSLNAHSSYKRLKEIADNLDVTVHALSLLWLISKPNVVAIPRTLSLTHLRENMSCNDKFLGLEVSNEIDALFEPNVVKVTPANIVVVDAHDRSVYKTLEEALRNDLNLVPSPLQMSERFLKGEVPKPLKLRKLPGGTFALIEGRLKYWGWVIAFGLDSRPLDGIIED